MKQKFSLHTPLYAPFSFKNIKDTKGKCCLVFRAPRVNLVLTNM